MQKITFGSSGRACSAAGKCGNNSDSYTTATWIHGAIAASRREVLASLKQDPRTRDVPVIIQSAKTTTAAEREVLLREAVALIPKDHVSSERSHALISEALAKAGIYINQPATSA